MVSGWPLNLCKRQSGGDFEQLGRRRLPADGAMGTLAGSIIC
jgi:hypothetical protein